MTAQDIAQVVADAVEREGLDADEVLVAVAAELVERRRGRGPVSPILSVFAQHPTLAELEVMVQALRDARRPSPMFQRHTQSDPWNGMGGGHGGGGVVERGTAGADAAVTRVVILTRWPGGPPPVCVSCGGPRDRADSDQCGECRD